MAYMDSCMGARSTVVHSMPSARQLAHFEKLRGGSLAARAACTRAGVVTARVIARSKHSHVAIECMKGAFASANSL